MTGCVACLWMHKMSMVAGRCELGALDPFVAATVCFLRNPSRHKLKLLLAVRPSRTARSMTSGSRARARRLVGAVV